LSVGAATVFDSTRIPGEIVDLIAVRAASLERQPVAIRSLLTGWFDALDYIRTSPQDAARRMGIRQQVGQEQFLQGLAQIRLPTRADNLRMLSGPAPELNRTAQKLMALMLEANLLRAQVEFETLLAPGPLTSLPP